MYDYEDSELIDSFLVVWIEKNVPKLHKSLLNFIVWFANIARYFKR